MHLRHITSAWLLLTEEGGAGDGDVRRGTALLTVVVAIVVVTAVRVG